MRVERSVEQVVVLLGVLKAAYVAVDPQDPLARVSAVLGHASAQAVLAGPDLELTVLAEVDGSRPDRAPGLADTAYAAYSSASTGRPKGVCVPHRAVHRLVVGGHVEIQPEQVTGWQEYVVPERYHPVTLEGEVHTFLKAPAELMARFAEGLAQ